MCTPGIVAAMRPDPNGGFVRPQIPQSPIPMFSLLQRRRMAGRAGVGSTFLTGANGIGDSKLNLTGNSLLGS